MLSGRPAALRIRPPTPCFWRGWLCSSAAGTLACRAVRIVADGPAQRGDHRHCGTSCPAAAVRSVAALDRVRHAGAALRRPLLSDRGTLSLPDLAAYAAGGRGLAAP